MGWFKDGVTALVQRPDEEAIRIGPPWAPVASWESRRPELLPAKYNTYAKEGYSGNEIVFACIEELATSAAEPGLRARYGQRWTKEHAILRLLERPNPFMDRFEFIATVIMHRALAGNAYALKVRNNMGRPLELWLLRPDRVRIVPDENRFISHYEYFLGSGQSIIGSPAIRLPVEDVIHWKTRNPINDFYGMPPLLPISGRVDIDNFMRDFVMAFFKNAGVPGGMLTIKGRLTDDQREELRARYKMQYNGVRGWHDLMVLDNAEATFTPMTQAMGAQGLVIPELNQVNESRIAMVFGVPLSLIGTIVGAGNSSYSNKKSERESFWNETLKPLYREIAGPLNLYLTRDFPGVDEVGFDLTEVGALGGDLDLLHARLRADLMAGAITLEEFRDQTGMAVNPTGTFLIPSNLVPTPVNAGTLAPPQPAPSGNGVQTPAGTPTNGVSAVISNGH